MSAAKMLAQKWHPDPTARSTIVLGGADDDDGNEILPNGMPKQVVPMLASSANVDEKTPKNPDTLLGRIEERLGRDGHQMAKEDTDADAQKKRKIKSAADEADAKKKTSAPPKRDTKDDDGLFEALHAADTPAETLEQALPDSEGDDKVLPDYEGDGKGKDDDDSDAWREELSASYTQAATDTQAAGRRLFAEESLAF